MDYDYHEDMRDNCLLRRVKNVSSDCEKSFTGHSFSDHWLNFIDATARNRTIFNLLAVPANSLKMVLSYPQA